MRRQTKKCELVVPVYEFRPILSRFYGDIFRHNNGEWIVDDGEYDIAFAQPDDCMAYCVDVPSRENIIWSWVVNGDWGARVVGHPGQNGWHYMLREGETEWGECWSTNCHVNKIAYEKAKDFVASKNRCANSRGPEFIINNPYISQGLLRLRDTKEVVVFPKIFKCMYCGDIDWQAVEGKA